jgi:hypothetical protein
MKEYILPIGGEDFHTIVDEIREYQQIVGARPNVIEMDDSKFHRIMANSEMGKHVYFFKDPKKRQLFGCKIKITNAGVCCLENSSKTTRTSLPNLT